MKCVYCDCTESRVTDSRPTEDGSAIRRRRECIKCSKRFTTYEKVEQPTILVVKSNDRREAFNPEKIRIGIIRACEKRPVSAGNINTMVASVEKWIYNSLHQEVTSNAIGEKVMEILKDVDQVAYVRFASVYRQFEDISSFEEALNNLKKS